LLTDRNEKINLYRGPAIYASYQVSFHLDEGFQKRRLKCEKLTDDERQVMAKVYIALKKKTIKATVPQLNIKTLRVVQHQITNNIKCNYFTMFYLKT
jgi:hypothetical protein